MSDINFLSSFVLLVVMTFKAELTQKKKFTDFKPTKWGKGSEHISEQVDEILYE